MKSTTAYVAVALRIFVAFFTRTFFQPDEYFQSLEPAHRIVFGYGHLTWEWLTPSPLRSVLYPALNVPVYWILKCFSLDHSWLLIAGPKILHGGLAALTDVWICELTRKTLGERYVSTAFFLSLSSFFNVLSLSRSLSNSLETSLTTIAFSYYPWQTHTYSQGNTRLMLVYAALACAIRPTNAVLWLYMIGSLLWRSRNQKYILFSIVFSAVAIGSFSLLTLFGVDSLYYGSPTFTPLNFLRTNFSPVSLFYGQSPMHYYFIQALPILCTTALPFFLHGAWTAHGKSLRTMLGCISWTIAVYSLAGHKEWRFLHPLLPLMHIFSAKSLVDNPLTAKAKTDTVVPIRPRVIAFLLLTAPASIYVMLFHCSSQINVMHYLHNIPSHELHSVGFLMPCHSTPAHAYLHRAELAQEGKLWALGCEPPLGLSMEEFAGYKDQTDIFFDSPLDYLGRYFPEHVDTTFPPSPLPCSPAGIHLSNWQHNWPQHLVMFGALLKIKGVKDILGQKGYSEVWRNGWEWEGEGKRKGGVRVWQHSGKRL